VLNPIYRIYGVGVLSAVGLLISSSWHRLLIRTAGITKYIVTTSNVC